jgi:hypothetical protein
LSAPAPGQPPAADLHQPLCSQVRHQAAPEAEQSPFLSQLCHSFITTFVISNWHTVGKSSIRWRPLVLSWTEDEDLARIWE